MCCCGTRASRRPGCSRRGSAGDPAPPGPSPSPPPNPPAPPTRRGARSLLRPAAPPGDVDEGATGVLLRNARVGATWVVEAGDREDPARLGPPPPPRLEHPGRLDAQGRPFQLATGAPRNGNAMPAWLERLPSAG